MNEMVTCQWIHENIMPDEYIGINNRNECLNTNHIMYMYYLRLKQEYENPHELVKQEDVEAKPTVMIGLEQVDFSTGTYKAVSDSPVPEAVTVKVAFRPPGNNDTRIYADCVIPAGAMQSDVLPADNSLTGSYRKGIESLSIGDKEGLYGTEYNGVFYWSASGEHTVINKDSKPEITLSLHCDVKDGQADIYVTSSAACQEDFLVDIGFPHTRWLKALVMHKDSSETDHYQTYAEMSDRIRIMGIGPSLNRYDWGNAVYIPAPGDGTLIPDSV